ncbi:MAG: peptidoglycan-binding domain-containing protein [Nocardioides sp.]
MSARTPGQAIAYARAHQTNEEGFCLRYVRTAFDVGPKFLTAADAWRGAQFKHPVTKGVLVPRGAPVLWTGGSRGAGHIAIATGNGDCWSSDAGGSGIVAKVNIDELTARWRITFEGWVEDLNGVHVFDASSSPMKAGAARISLKKVQPSPSDDVRALQQMLKKRLPDASRGVVVDGLFGPETQEAYAAWQRRCGFRGKDADGKPGKVSLQRLGFDVRS